MKESTKTFVLDGRKYEIELRYPESDRRRSTSNRSIAFVWEEIVDQIDDSMLQKAADVAGAETIYTKMGDFPLVDEAFKIHNAVIIAVKHRLLFRALLECVGAETMKGVTLTFSRKAGCKCGCSPGFIVRGLPLSLEIFVQRLKEKKEVKHAA